MLFFWFTFTALILIRVGFDLKSALYDDDIKNQEGVVIYNATIVIFMGLITAMLIQEGAM